MILRRADNQRLCISSCLIKDTKMKSTTMFKRAKTRTLAFGIVIVLGVGIAMSFVLIYIETGSADTYETAVPHRVNCASGILYGCSNVGNQGQVNTGTNTALQ
jgi:hypothetical protein